MSTIESTIADADLLGGGNLFASYVNPCMKDLVMQKEQNIRELLNKIAPGWTLDEIKERLKFVIFATDPLKRETLYLDGKPIMEFYPLEQSHKSEGDSVRFIVTQRYRVL